MADPDDVGRSPSSRGCLITGVGAAALALFSPIVLTIRGWRTWRRGSEIRRATEISSISNSKGADLCRIDIELDVPQSAEPGFRDRLTESVVRTAETLRVADDVYHLVYRFPWDEEPVMLPVGPQLQEFGERFSLVQSQGAMAGRTAVWLTLGRDRTLAEVVGPVAYDPEADGEPDRLLTHPDPRWSMATEWARIGPSLVFRMIVIVPFAAKGRVLPILDRLC